MHANHIRVDAETRSVTGRPAPRGLWLRGTAFLLLGVGLPLVVLGGGGPPSWLTVPVLLVTVATAAWLTSGLREGWEIDDHGIRLDTGRRRPTHVPWGELGELSVEGRPSGAALVAHRRDGRRVELTQAGSAAPLRRAVVAAADLDLLPVHVTVDGDEQPPPAP